MVDYCIAMLFGKVKIKFSCGNWISCRGTVNGNFEQISIRKSTLRRKCPHVLTFRFYTVHNYVFL